MRRMILLIIAALSLTLLVVLIISYKVTLEVDLGVIDKPLNTEVRAEGLSLDPSGENATVFTTKLRPGKYILTIKNPGYNIVKQDVSVGIFGSKVSPELTKVDEKNAAVFSYNDVSGVKYSNEKFFLNNTWVVFEAGADSGESDGSLVVSRLDTNGKWKVVLEGSSIDYDAALEPIPDEVKIYLESL